jgi:hypothetical protein
MPMLSILKAIATGLCSASGAQTHRTTTSAPSAWTLLDRLTGACARFDRDPVPQVIVRDAGEHAAGARSTTEQQQPQWNSSVNVVTLVSPLLLVLGSGSVDLCPSWTAGSLSYTCRRIDRLSQAQILRVTEAHRHREPAASTLEFHWVPS